MATATVNGIQLEALQQTIQEIQKKPEMARFKFKTSNQWIDGMHNQAMVQNFVYANTEDQSRQTPLKYDEDEPPLLLGHNQGANPTEYVLVALSGCLTSSLIAHAAAQGIQLKSVESELEGDLDLRGFLGLSETVRNGYEGIRVKFKIESDAPEEKIRELVQVAQQRSPVFDIVTHPVPVSVGYEYQKVNR